MSSHPTRMGPVCAAAVGFVSLIGAVIAVTVAQKMSLLGWGESKRALGLVIGIMALISGNLLPKIRPLSGLPSDSSKSLAAERFAGWTLVSAGLAYVVLFLFVPLYQAAPISSYIGIIAIAAIAITWVGLLPSALARHHRIIELTTNTVTQTNGRSRLMLHLLFAFFWVLALACAVFLFDGQPWVKQLTLWMTIGFCLLQALLTALLRG